jgi:hypothetical protein
MRKAHEHLSVLRDIGLAADLQVPTCMVLSVDVEVYVRGSGTEVLEIGLAWAPCAALRDRTQQPTRFHCYHFIIKEYAHYRNEGDYDQRDNFLFGVSEWVSKTEAAGRMTQLLEDVATPENKVFLVGHTIQNDIKWLSHVDIDLSLLIPNIVQCDIGKAFQAIQDEINVRGMDYMEDFCGLEKIPGHNGGNDALRHVMVCGEVMKYYGAGDGQEMDQVDADHVSNSGCTSSVAVANQDGDFTSCMLGLSESILKVHNGDDKDTGCVLQKIPGV